MLGYTGSWGGGTRSAIGCLGRVLFNPTYRFKLLFLIRVGKRIAFKLSCFSFFLNWIELFKCFEDCIQCKLYNVYCTLYTAHGTVHIKIRSRSKKTFVCFLPGADTDFFGSKDSKRIKINEFMNVSAPAFYLFTLLLFFLRSDDGGFKAEKPWSLDKSWK